MSELATIQNTGMAPLVEAVMSGNLDPEKLAQFLEVQKDFEANEAKKAYHQAVADFKRNPPKVAKDKENKQFNSWYVSKENLVNTVNAALSEHQLTARWEVEQSDPTLIKVTCFLTHAMGHFESAAMSAPPDVSGAKNTIQQIKSTKTYLEIATYESVTGVASYGSMDDDGNSTEPPMAQALYAHNMALKDWLVSVVMIKDNLRDGEGGDIDAAAEAYAEFPLPVLSALNVAPSKGGIWTTDERKQFKENKEFRDAVQVRRKDSGWHDDPENKI